MYKSLNKRVYAAFVDYKKAFDFVDRTSLWQKLLNTGVNGRVLRVIFNMYSKAKSCVRAGSHATESFVCNMGVRQGENLSPVLFAIFLNDFEYYLSRNGEYNGLANLSHLFQQHCHDEEIQIFYKLYVLLFADDTIILAESYEELQAALNSLHEYCQNWKLTVNASKTKVVVFSRGVIQVETTHAPLIFGVERLDYVRDYTYLGTRFYCNGKFKLAIEKQVEQAGAAVRALRWRASKLRLPIDLTLDLFQPCVASILCYGSEVWGFSDLEPVETFHKKFLKRLLKVRASTNDLMVYGETGSFPMSVYIDSRMVGFWARLITGKKSKISFMMYKLMRSMHENPNIEYQSEWISHVRSLLLLSGFDNLWRDQPDDFSVNEVKSRVTEKLKNRFIRLWKHDMDQSPSCVHYNEFKPEFGLAPYLLKTSYGDRISLARFRCRSNYTPIASIETIVRQNIDQEYEPICLICGEDYPDEEHYLLKCLYFECHRERFIYPIVQNPSQLDINYLMNLSEPSHLKKLASFVSIVLDVFEHRHTRIPGIFN